MSSIPPSPWNARFAGDDYLFGEAPNAFLAAQAARKVQGPEPSEEEIVEAVRRTREDLYRERYGAA